MRIDVPHLERSQQISPLEQNSHFPSVSDRRSGTSDLEDAAEILEHAIEHLVSEQMDGQHSPARAHAEAVILLCRALDEVARRERRAPARWSIGTWLRRTVYRDERVG